jgi:hypothetical protein
MQCVKTQQNVASESSKNRILFVGKVDTSKENRGSIAAIVDYSGPSFLKFESCHQPYEV